MMDKLQSAMERVREQHRSAQAPPRFTSGHIASQSAVIYSRTRSLVIPPYVLRQHRILIGHDSPFADAYKILRTQVLHRLRENGWNVLGISSPRDGEGKTLTAINLAIAMAAEPTHTVLLVDADLRSPRIPGEFGLDVQEGLTQFLLDGRPIEELLIYPNLGRLIFLPAGRATEQSAELLTTPRMSALSKELKHRYTSRVVVFDLPPVLGRADVLAFAPQLDALLLVVEEGKTSEPELQQALQVLKGSTPILGTVLNKHGRDELSLSKLRRLGALETKPAP
ncbi:CpsD/CapB family tyrosine-protein kinase [Nitrospira moscoviensis]|uniref:Putative Exopolysaccharide biosynthesis related tyrosine-protein kinase n=1 Tax=Nitrospira moscoviensis TaxID=42253 RepID=A0A0K2GJK3_NITMO|nr:CpsD/CapB family tyrosine-protein kinase [Nitrospira moscoviensis]ALA61130.1 putative Exopolysaccharide biosynthesis related tyrosine-protein kinase [Nitrospira moscoviensis]